MTSNEAQMQLHTFETDDHFYAVFLYFRDTGDLPGSIGARKIITCMCCTTRIAVAMAAVKKDITAEKVVRWYFRVLFFPYGLTKIIIVDEDGVFVGVLKRVFS